MIEFRNATCRFVHGGGAMVNAINNLNLDVASGEFVCLLGRSGHGKSTMVRALAGLQPLTSGEILIDGRAVSAPGAGPGMVFQEDTVFPWMSVRDNVEFGLRARGLPALRRRSESDRWLEAVGLKGFASSWPAQMSGGMRKRVAIATVFANGSRILIMDEPFGPLDYVTRRELQDLVLALWRETGSTIIFITHDIEEALVLAQRILVVRSGGIADDIRTDLPYPRSEEVRALPRAVEISKAILRTLELSSASLHHGAGEVH